MQTFSETDLRDAQALLPDSVQQLISVIGFPALTRLIRSFGGVTLSGKTGAHAERTGGVHALLHDVLTEDEINKLIRFLGGAPFYIPRCDHALPEQWQQLSFPLFWQGCELQVTLDAQRIAIRTSAPVSLRLNGQLISVAEESVFCLGDFILPFNGTATKHQEDE